MAGAPVLVGIWAARRRLLEEPARHLPLLQRVAVLGLTVAAAGALPTTLQAIGVWTPGSAGVGFAAACLHTVTGLAGGFAYAAIVALVVVRLRDRRGPLVTALSACGQRSMTCYLAQSVVWLVCRRGAAGAVGDDRRARGRCGRRAGGDLRRAAREPDRHRLW
jgi:uncharacterized membrane protein YeiB